MGRLVLFLILGFGAAMYFPETRTPIVEFLEPAMDPIFRWQTRGEMKNIARELAGMEHRGEGLPAPGDQFQRWMGRNFQGGTSQDAWGNVYMLRIGTDSLVVVSGGPDLEVNTADDLEVSAPLDNPREDRRRRR